MKENFVALARKAATPKPISDAGNERGIKLINLEAKLLKVHPTMGESAFNQI